MFCAVVCTSALHTSSAAFRPRLDSKDREEELSTCLIAVLDEVVTQLLDGVGALARLDALIVETDEDGLVGLHGAEAGGALLAVDRASVGLEGHVLDTSEGDARGESRAGVVEGVEDLLGLIRLDREASGGRPGRAIVADDDGTLAVASANEVRVNVLLR